MLEADRAEMGYFEGISRSICRDFHLHGTILANISRYASARSDAPSAAKLVKPTG